MAGNPRDATPSRNSARQALDKGVRGIFCNGSKRVFCAKPAFRRQAAKDCFQFPFASCPPRRTKRKKRNNSRKACLPQAGRQAAKESSLRLCAQKKTAAEDPQIFCFPKDLSALFFLIDPREKKEIIAQRRQAAKDFSLDLILRVRRILLYFRIFSSFSVG